MKQFEVIGLVPAQWSHPGIAIAVSRNGGTGILDLEFCADSERAQQNFNSLIAATESAIGLRFGIGQLALAEQLLASRPARALTLICCGSADHALKLRRHFSAIEANWLAEVTTLEAARQLDGRFNALIARGHEGGGWVGQDSSSILLQKLMQARSAPAPVRTPILVHGGIGIRSAVACRAAGAAGVVLDDVLLLLSESALPANLQNELARLNGAECKPYGDLLGHPCRVYARAGSAALAAAEHEIRQADGGNLSIADWAQQFGARIGWSADQLLPLGQGIGLAAGYRQRYTSTARLLQALRRALRQQIDLAIAHQPLAENSALAQSHGTRYPLAQGPMTRVSDSPAFAAEVAAAGALPFLALALMRGPQVREMLQDTQKRIGNMPWGVGMLGFIPQALRNEQCAEILACKPTFALIAGGRPDQAAEFEREGIPTYIHAPAPALLALYLEQGARRFVFEGRECGGHVGPIASFPLWEQMIDVLLAQVAVGDEKNIHVLFAGGIHDATSAAMVAAMTAPLAARGMKVGALMGTAYLFTREIVSSGAIVAGFQDAALSCTQTLNLESGPGHASRCVETKFARDFYDTRRQLIRDGRSVEDIRDALEDLNLGRLRIASKGLDRDATGKVVVVSDARQRDDGMFMIGQVATLRDHVVSIAELHANVCDGANAVLGACADAITPMIAAQPSDIAIIGIGVTLPRANTPDDYWELILKQISVIREAPKQRWDSELIYDADPKARDKVYSKWGGFLDEIAFDPLKFGIPPKSMKSIDPLQLLTLETAARTLADAGYADGQFDRERASVILGAGGGAGDLGQQYAMRAELPRFVENLSPEVWDRLPEWTEESFAGTLLNVAAGRVANRLDFGGVNFVVDAACGSSLAAISLAINELETGRSNFVLAGGFDTTQSAYAFTAFAKTQALSISGKPRTFDQDADGIAISEGVAMVALKRLKDAERDGDRIYAVIKATAGSSDGKALGLTAPRTEGQVRALNRAYAKAGFSPATLDLVEAHGTGTPVGDRTEAQTVARALLESGAAPRSAAIGSVKTLLGHTKAAAGAAGLIKVALALHHRVLPGHAGVEKPIDVISDPNAPIYLLKDPRPWLAPKDHPRRGAASAFGFGGTNFHAVLEEYRGQRATPGARRWPSELFVFRGADAGSLCVSLQRKIDALASNSPLQAGELAQALARDADQKRGLPVAVAIVAADLAALKKDLATAIEHLSGAQNAARPLPPHIRINRALPAAAPSVAFLFPGQGAQHVNMGREAALYLEEVRSALEFAEHTLADQLPDRLSARMYPPAAFDAQTEQLQALAITDTRYAQPAIGALSLGYLRFAERIGLSAVATAGHSYGEYTALLAAGVLEPADFMRLSAERGRAMAQAAAVSVPGGMVAVQAGRDEVLKHIADLDGVCVANHNAPQQSVISGPKAALARATERLEAAGLRAVALPVSGAFHTELVAPAKVALSSAIHATRFSSPKLAVYSNTSGQPYPQEPAAMQRQLDQHLLSSVEFVSEIEAMHAAGVRVFVELGPRGICAGLARQILAGRDALAISLDTGAQGLRGLQLGLAELFVAGVSFDVAALYAQRDLPLLDLAQLRERAAVPVLAKHVWMLSGGCARPQLEPEQRTGKLPALTAASAASARADIEAKLEATIRARLPASVLAPTGTAAPSALSNEALIAYQQTMRQFLDLQERVVQQYLGGTPLPQSAALNLPGIPLPAVAAPVAPAIVTPATMPAAAPVMNAISASTATRVERTDFKTVLLTIVADRTGYPTDMLGLDADLEADLGIDSIKRVEIVGALRKAVPETIAAAIQQNMERYTKVKTLNAILTALQALAPATTAAEISAPTASASHLTPLSSTDFQSTLVAIVADRTGYPTDMLGLDADLEADLGID
ncbi:MAG: acyltransferase domain-containing protein, partial [Pseudomonadota bacterium]|nr:acyltransferase domain-containing protein [Pseudomonadota bacterium]